MGRAFPDRGKGFPHALGGLRDAVKGGIVADSLPITSGADPVAIDPSVYKHLVTSGGTQGNEVVQVPSAAEVGQRVLIEFAVEGDASDVVRINDDGSSSIQSQGAVGETPSAVTNIDLDTPGEFALLEYQGGDVWNLLYTSGAVS